MRHLISFKALISSLFILVAFQSHAKPALVVQDLKVIEESYSHKVISINYHYDGSLGDRIWIGALAHGEVALNGAGFSPMTIQKGVNEVKMGISRPKTSSPTKVISELHTDEIQFTIYNKSKSIQQDYPYSLSWPSFNAYFEISNSDSKLYQFKSLRSIMVLENTTNYKALVKDLVASGLSAKHIEIYNKSMHQQSSEVSLDISESVEFPDIDYLVGLLQTHNISIESYKITGHDKRGFKLGHIMMPDSTIRYPGTWEPTLFAEAVSTKSLEPLYQAVGFAGTKKDSFNEKLFNKVITLNDKGTKRGGEEAKELTDYLLSIGYENDRLYAEIARAYGRIYGYQNEGYAKRKSVLDLALSFNPENQWAHSLKIFDETNVGNLEAAEKHAHLAVKYEKELNVWTTVNFARLLEAQNRNQEANDKYKELLLLSHLKPSNARAHKRGLAYYISFIQRTHVAELEGVYRVLVENYGQTMPCENLNLAKEIIKNKTDRSEARMLVKKAGVDSCQNKDEVLALLETIDWFMSDGNTSIKRSLIKHGDITRLISDVATMPEGDGILALLKKHKINLSTKDAQGMTALHLAVANQEVSAVAKLAAQGLDVNATLSNGWSSLMIAVYLDSPELVEVLLKQGAEKHWTNPQGLTALMIANQINNPKVINLLNGQGA